MVVPEGFRSGDSSLVVDLGLDTVDLAGDRDRAVDRCLGERDRDWFLLMFCRKSWMLLTAVRISAISSCRAAVLEPVRLLDLDLDRSGDSDRLSLSVLSVWGAVSYSSSLYLAGRRVCLRGSASSCPFDAFLDTFLRDGIVSGNRI